MCTAAIYDATVGLFKLVQHLSDVDSSHTIADSVA